MRKTLEEELNLSTLISVALGQGKTFREIASTLHCSFSTIRKVLTKVEPTVITLNNNNNQINDIITDIAVLENNLSGRLTIRTKTVLTELEKIMHKLEDLA